jgi:hypothetical protein
MPQEAGVHGGVVSIGQYFVGEKAMGGASRGGRWKT